jgi:hypothetical protein
MAHLVLQKKKKKEKRKGIAQDRDTLQTHY